MGKSSHILTSKMASEDRKTNTSESTQKAVNILKLDSSTIASSTTEIQDEACRGKGITIMKHNIEKICTCMVGDFC